MSTKSIEILTEEFNKLPSIGKKTAQRLAFAILEMEDDEVEYFAKALLDVKKNVKKCSVCGNFSEEELCHICSDATRDHKTICVVEDSKDIAALERAKSYRGIYHVLHGKIAPLSGKTLDQLNIQNLVERVDKNGVKEVIMALNPDLEGETTSMYLTKLLKNFDIKISRIASGIPMGGNLEYADMATIIKSMEGRRELKDE